MLCPCGFLDHYERLPIPKRQLPYPIPAVRRDPPSRPAARSSWLKTEANKWRKHRRTLKRMHADLMAIFHKFDYQPRRLPARRGHPAHYWRTAHSVQDYAGSCCGMAHYWMPWQMNVLILV